MRAPRDVTEGSGVGLGEEEGGVIPLGEQRTRGSHTTGLPSPGVGGGGIALLLIIHLFRPGAGDESDTPLPCPPALEGSIACHLEPQRPV